MSAAPLQVAELTRRRYRGKTPKPIRGPEHVFELIGKKFIAESREHFVAILLNARHEPIEVETISVGSLNASIVHPREVFRPAILPAAASIMVAHNHPSGDPEPSEEDLSITRRLAQIGELVGIGLLDHIVIVRRPASFRIRRSPIDQLHVHEYVMRSSL